MWAGSQRVYRSSLIESRLRVRFVAALGALVALLLIAMKLVPKFPAISHARSGLRSLYGFYSAQRCIGIALHRQEKLSERSCILFTRPSLTANDPYLHLGPLTLPTFGLMVATGLLFLLISSRPIFGAGDSRGRFPDYRDRSLSGIVGARLYHVLESPPNFSLIPGRCLLAVLASPGSADFSEALPRYDSRPSRENSNAHLS